MDLPDIETILESAIAAYTNVTGRTSPQTRRYEHVVLVEMMRQQFLLQILQLAQDGELSDQMLTALNAITSAIYKSA